MSSEEHLNLKYIGELFDSNNALLLNFSSYATFISTLSERHKDTLQEFHTTLSEEETKLIDQLVSNIKYYVIYTFKKVKALQIFLQFQVEEFKTLESKYKLIRDSAIPKVDDVDSFIDMINFALVDSRVSLLFDDKLEQINEMYGNDTTKTTTDN